MSRIVIHGTGAVSPAGWGRSELMNALAAKTPPVASTITFPGRADGLAVRRVPNPAAPFPWMRHPRLRRVSAISRFATAAALEALGADAVKVSDGSLRLGIVFSVMAGCVNYSSRFYQEVLANPGTASPLVFPETVFNAPASHLAAFLGAGDLNYTQVGDDSAFVQGLVTAAGWLCEDRVDGCLVIAAEECDWLTAEAMRLFDRESILSEGAGAVYLKRNGRGIVLESITSPHVFRSRAQRFAAVQNVRRELESLGPADLLFDSVVAQTQMERDLESRAWAGFPADRISVRSYGGNAFCASAAWQMIAAVSALEQRAERRAFVSVAGTNQAAIGLSLVSP